MLNKVNKTIGLLRKLHNTLPRLPLLTICKSFIRPHIDYGDIIYDQEYIVSFHQKLKSIQYKSALALTGAIRRISAEKLCNELGLETLQKTRWYRKLCCFYKVDISHYPKYILNIIPVTVSKYNTRNTNNIPQCKVKDIIFRNSFFPSAIIEWDKLDLNIRNSESSNIFKKSLLKFKGPSGSSVFNCHNLRGVKLLTKIRLGLSHLRKHNFKHGFLYLARDDTHMTSMNIVQFSRPPTSLVHLQPKFFHPPDLGRPISIDRPPPPLQIITNRLKENIIQGRLLYVIRSFLQVGFRFQYQLINLIRLSFEFFSFS